MAEKAQSAEDPAAKWEGKHAADLQSATADEIWPFLEDFCNIHKWFPNLDTCYQVEEGEPGQPGLIRYCASTTPLSSDGGGAGNNDTQVISWVKEKLLMINPTERCLSYGVVESNMGFKSYVATIKVLPIDGDGQHGSKMEFSFVADPIEGWRFEDLDGYVKYCVQFMANKMEEDVVKSR